MERTTTLKLAVAAIIGGLVFTAFAGTDGLADDPAMVQACAGPERSWAVAAAARNDHRRG